MFRAWMVVALLWVVALLNYLDRLAIAAMRDSIKADISMTDAQFGLLTSVFLWVYASLSPGTGFLADRYSRSRVIVASLFVWSLMTYMTGHCHSVNQLLAVRALMGLGEACYIPAALALIADYHQGSTRSLATGVHMSGIYTGMALGGVGGYIAEWFGWRAGFSLLGFFGMGYAVLLMLLLRDAPARDQEARFSHEKDEIAPAASRITFVAALTSLSRQPSFYLLVLHWGLLALAGWGVAAWLPTYLRVHFNMSQGAAGMSATGYVQSASFMGIFIGGAWADAWSRRNARARLMVVVIGFMISGPALFMAASADVFWFAVAGLVVYGLSRGFSDSNMMPILCQVADARYRATGYGIMNCFSCAVGGLVAYGAGALMDQQVDLGRVFQVAAVGIVISAVLLLFVRPRRDAVFE